MSTNIALWSVLHHGIGSNPYGILSSNTVQPVAAVGLAAVSDLYNGCLTGTASPSAIRNLHGVGSCSGVDPYKTFTSPMQMLGTATQEIAFYLAHGSNDGTVDPVQSSDFVTAASTNPLFTVEPDPFSTFPGEGHFDVIDPASTSWTSGVVPFLESVLIPECEVNGDCDDNDVCNGLETCDSNLVCQAGTPLVCDDGLFCNGLETCDPISGCQSGIPLVCSHGCDEARDTCFECTVDSDCDDSLFCNGVESCVNGYCEQGSDPCPGQGCDEVSDSCVACDDNGICDASEDCNTCPNDCIGGQTSGAECGNGICEAGNGEDCVSCPADCNGKQTGSPSNRFCCGDGDGINPITCADSRCTTGSWDCTDTPANPITYCCGDGICEGDETQCNCAVDCGVPPPTEEGLCSDGIDNDCDGLIDEADPDCQGGTPPTCGGNKDPCVDDSDCCSLNCSGGTCKGNRRLLRHPVAPWKD